MERIEGDIKVIDLVLLRTRNLVDSTIFQLLPDNLNEAHATSPNPKWAWFKGSAFSFADATGPSSSSATAQGPSTASALACGSS